MCFVKLYILINKSCSILCVCIYTVLIVFNYYGYIKKAFMFKSACNYVKVFFFSESHALLCNFFRTSSFVQMFIAKITFKCCIMFFMCFANQNVYFQNLNHLLYVLFFMIISSEEYGYSHAEVMWPVNVVFPYMST